MKKFIAMVSMVLGLGGAFAAFAPSASAVEQCSIVRVSVTVSPILDRTTICIVEEG